VGKLSCPHPVPPFDSKKKMPEATINKKKVDPIGDNDNTSGYANNEIDTSSTDHHVTMTTLEVEDKRKKDTYIFTLQN
jgi:hypothetical protein